MRTEVKAVKITDKASGGLKKVSEVEVPVYETIDELLEHESEEHILNMFNKQNIIRLQGNERAKFKTTRAGKAKRRMLAFNTLTPEEISRFAGDFEGLQAYLDSPEVQARIADSESS